MIGNQIAGFYGLGVPPIPPGNFESIATLAASGSSATLTFSSIPSTYKHLQIRGIVRTTAGSNNWDVSVQCNGDTGTSYSAHALFVDGGGTVPNTGDGNQGAMKLDRAGVGTADIFSGVIVDFLDYKNTNKFKTMRAWNGNDRNGSGLLAFNSGCWRSGDAINSITFTMTAGNFATNSTLALYGIAGA
jgi:hypothetical protein